MPVLKVDLTPYMEKLVETVADAMGKSRTAALEALLYRVELMAKHEKLTEAFGLDWIDAAAVLKLAGMGAAAKDPVLAGGGEAVDFDVKLLETSRASKSGYAGVYATGSAFRALVTDPKTNGSRYLQSRPTAVLAAIDRFKWYEQWAMPYGLVGDFLNAEIYDNVAFKNLPEPRRTLLGLEYALHVVTTVPGVKIKPDPMQLRATIKRYRELHGMVPEDQDPTMETAKDRFWVPAKFTPDRPTPAIFTKAKTKPKVSSKLVEVSPQVSAVPTPKLEPVQEPLPFVDVPVQEPLSFVDDSGPELGAVVEEEPYTEPSEEEPYTEPSEEDLCVVCKKLIKGDERYTWFGKTNDVVHVLCIEADGSPRASKVAEQ
jgi:hypothetical protein